MGLPVSVADSFGQFWGGWIPHNQTYGNYSSLGMNGTAFSQDHAPMPILTLAKAIPGQSPNTGGLLYSGFNGTDGFNLTSYEITLYEFSTWAWGRIQDFMLTRYLGSSMTAEPCSTGAHASRASTSSCLPRVLPPMRSLPGWPTTLTAPPSSPTGDPLRWCRLQVAWVASISRQGRATMSLCSLSTRLRAHSA